MLLCRDLPFLLTKIIGTPEVCHSPGETGILAVLPEIWIYPTYFQSRGFLAMAAITGGEIQGSVVNPQDRSPSVYGKLGYDQQVNELLKWRITGSLYSTGKSLNNTLYGGDRTGSRYYLVMEPVGARTSSNFTSSRFNPDFRDEVTALMINPFIQYQGLELFGTFETATGRARGETSERTWNQGCGCAVQVLTAG